ncbi:MAG TPA: hypothetical protein VD978_37275 [Azospirillum sp.]|nr:hypothetical protein [Azospirillum sp.]
MRHPDLMPVLSRTEFTDVEATRRTDIPHQRTHCAPPEPIMEKIRGPKLVILWAVLIALSWAVVLGLGYGLYSIVRELL